MSDYIGRKNKNFILPSPSVYQIYIGLNKPCNKGTEKNMKNRGYAKLVAFSYSVSPFTSQSTRTFFPTDTIIFPGDYYTSEEKDDYSG